MRGVCEGQVLRDCQRADFSEDEAHGLLLGLVGPVAPSKVVFGENVTFLLVTVFVVLV